MHASHTQLSQLDTDLPRFVNRELAVFLDQQRLAATDIDETFAVAVDMMARFVLGGGKRIRPAFAWWGWRGAGGDPHSLEAPAVLRAVSALELLQACALVHDDLMDASVMRRGSPTVHMEFADQHRAGGWLGEPHRFGLAAAIIIGDLALAWADDMLQSCGLSSAILSRLGPAWQGMRTEMLAGQYLDVFTQARGDESTTAALRVNRLKTAAYTVERPLHLGAAIAGAGPEFIEAYRQFGADLGVAFQLRDDLLGVFGDPEVTGKPAGDDLREGKRTLLVAMGFELAEHHGRTSATQTLRDAIGRADLDADQLAEVRALLTDLGAVAAIEEQIADLTDSAMRALHSAPVAEPAATRLAELAVAVTTRSH